MFLIFVLLVEQGEGVVEEEVYLFIEPLGLGTVVFGVNAG